MQSIAAERRRTVIHIADFHFQLKHIKRSAGQSAIACAAYRACEKLHSDYYDETNDFSKKGGLIHSEIMLPSYVSEKYKDREFLWNDVEKIETRKDAQLAYSFDFALMNEFTIEENIEIARRFIQENFVDRGMICDWAFHFPKSNEDEIDNPHIHLLCPMRPMNKDGTWGAKQRNEYFYDENGYVLRDENGRKKYNSVKTTDWSDPETLVEWRKAWADINNEKFKEKGLDIRISELSLEDQGLDLIPTIHEGSAVREMEKRGIITDKGEFNRQVRKTNIILTVIREYFTELVDWMKSLKEKPPTNPSILDVITDYYEGRIKNSYTNKLKAENLQNFSESIAYLQEKHISTFEELETEIKSQQEIYDKGKINRKKVKDKISELQKLQGRLTSYHNYKNVAEIYEKKVFGKDKFYREHESEIKRFYGCKKNIPDEWINEPNWDKKIESEIKKLSKQVEAYSNDIEPINSELLKLKKLKWCYEVSTGIINPDSNVKDNEKSSVLKKMEDMKKISKQKEIHNTKEHKYNCKINL